VTRGRLVRAFWLGAAALLVAAALIAIVALLRGELTETDGEILLTLGALFVAGAVGLSGLALAETGRYALLGWIAAALSPVEFAILVYWIWSDLSGDDLTRIGLTTILLVLGQLALVTQLLLLARRKFLPLVALTALLLAAAIAGTIAAIWAEPDDTSWAKALAVTWILAGLCWFLLPVLQRSAVAGDRSAERVLAVLDGVELVATRSPDGVDARLSRGERLLLRPRA